MEIVGKSKRTFAGIVFEYFFALGQLILVLMAYLIRDWRTLAWVAIVPAVPFISYYLYVYEIWLFWLAQKYLPFICFWAAFTWINSTDMWFEFCYNRIDYLLIKLIIIWEIIIINNYLWAVNKWPYLLNQTYISTMLINIQSYIFDFIKYLLHFV